jgi:hypothetical protein
MAFPRSPSRIDTPSATRDVQAAFADIYDKLHSLLPATTAATAAATPATQSTTTTSASTITVLSGGSGGSSGTSPYTNVPKLTTLPDNNPVIGAPYAVDGVLVFVNGVLYRYSGDPTYKWSIVAAALIEGTHASRVASYPAASYGATLFYETNTGLLLISDGTNWIYVSGTMSDTHANRVANWPSVQFPVGTLFLESDRNVTYIATTASGTVTTAGTAVTLVSGDHFVNSAAGFNAAQWPAGTPIVINGVTYTVSSVTNASALVLTATAGVQVGVAYSCVSGRWVYSKGEYSTTLANLPTDLGENGYNAFTGFLFYATDYLRRWEYASTGAAPASASPGWKRERNDIPMGQVTILPFGPGQYSAGWALCDGSAVTVTRDDATSTSVTAPNLVGAYPKGGTTGTYAPGQAAAVVPTITGSTASVSSGDSIGTTSANILAGTGASTSVLTGATLTTPGHLHGVGTLVNNNLGEPVHVVVPFYLRR